MTGLKHKPGVHLVVDGKRACDGEPVTLADSGSNERTPPTCLDCQAALGAEVVEGHSFDGTPFCFTCMPPGAESELPPETDVRPLQGLHECDSCGDLCGKRS